MSRLCLSAALLGLAVAADIAYVGDLKLFTSLAPCAASAIGNNIGSVSYSTSQCAGDETQLHSCVCSHTADFQAISSAISSDISSACSVTGDNTDDYSSASQVLKKYCSPDSQIAFSEPEHKVYAFITELSEITYLPNCGISAVSSAVSSVGYYRCPLDATLFAPCVCGKPGVVDLVTQTLSQMARSSCSNAEDASSAQNFFDEYCAMTAGTSEFAGPKEPPGDMTYYITDMPQYTSLRKCAQDALSEVVFWVC
jgi:hypothetical protein